MMGVSPPGPDGEKKETNRDKSVRLEKQSARKLGGRTVRGSGSSQFSKGDYRTTNASSPGGRGYNYQQKSSGKGVRIDADLLRKTRYEAAQDGRDPVLEIVLDGQEPWFCVPLAVWQHLSGERNDGV